MNPAASPSPALLAAVTAGGVQTAVSDVLLLAGGALILIAAVGLIRLPDSYNRVNAVTKGACLGLVCLLFGVLVRMPGVYTVLTVLVAVVLQLLTLPISGYAVVRACYRTGAPLAAITHTDELGGCAGPPNGEGRGSDGPDGGASGPSRRAG